MSFSKPQVSFSSSFALLFSVLKDNPSGLFWVKRYIISKKEPIKRDILRILSAHVKIHQIQVIFEITNHFFRILHQSSLL